MRRSSLLVSILFFTFPAICNLPAMASLQVATNYIAGTSPGVTAVADFNGDGAPDLAVANSGSKNVSVLLNKGSGSYATAVNYAVGNTPSYVVAADFNGDGVIDLAVLNSFDGTLSVLLGKGDGTFGAASTSTLFQGPTAAAVGDMNGDGKLDLVIVNSANNGSFVNVLLGNGDGTFHSAAQYQNLDYSPSVLVADFNDDGKLDVALPSVEFTGANYLQVYLGNGDGTLANPHNYVAGLGIHAVAAADLNGDGILDLAVTNAPGASGPGAVALLFGNGDGTFRTGQKITYPGLIPNNLAFADFNGDGKLDLAVTGSNMVGVFLGSGTGSFQFYREFGAGTDPVALVATDANRDGKTDLVVTNFGNSAVAGSISVLYGNGNGSFQASAFYASGQFGAALARGDFNGDGLLDLVTVAESVKLTEVVNVFLTNKDGSLGNALSTTLPTSAGDAIEIAVGDFDGDHKLDVALLSFNGFSVQIMLGNGDGTFRTGASFVAHAVAGLVTSDFNGDGKLDLAIPTGIFLGNGDGTFGSLIPFNVSAYGPSSVKTGDFNRDGKADLVVVDSCGTDPNCGSASSVSVLLGKGDGTFQPAVVYNVEFGAEYATLADFNNDGVLDLAVANFCGPNNTCVSGSFSVLLGNGDGSFQNAVNYATASKPLRLTGGDLNGDGKTDLAVIYASTLKGAPGGVELFLGDGTGKLATGTFYLSGQGPADLADGDFNGDGAQDLAVVDGGSTTLCVFLGTPKAKN